MNDTILEVLAKLAYNTHLGVKKDDENYFKKDYCTWEELPASTQLHWRNIVFCVFRKYKDIEDVGDLV